MKRKILSTLLVLCMLVSLLPTMALAASVYNDTDGHWAADAIDRWSGYGVVNGKGEGSFDPNGQMTRAEAAQVFANLLGLNKEGDISAYPDAQGEWYSEAIAKCVAAGILNGKGAGKMDPNGTVTREEFLTMYARAVCISNGADATEAKGELSQKGFADTAKVSDWAADAIGTLVDKGYVNGLTATELAPQANINRASVMALLNQSISTYVGKDSTETTVAAKSEGITLIANPAVTSVTGTADVVVVAAGAEQYDETGVKSEIVVDSTASVSKLTVSAEGAKVTVSGKVESVTVAETAKSATVETTSTSTVGTVTIAAESATASVAGKVESVTVAETAKSATVETKANSTVGTLNVAAEDAKTTVAGKVETVKVEETAKNVAVETTSTAKVTTVENKAENTAVTGTGSVGAVKSSEDVKVETKNTKVENTSETKDIAVTDSKGTETKVDSGTTGQTTPSAPTGGGGGHSHDFGADGTTKCSCGKFADDIVAAIGNQGYKTLAEAVAAADGATATTITLIQNVKQSNSIVVDKDVTLDLAGKDITVAADGDWKGVKPTRQAAFYVKSGAKFIVNDTIGTGSIDTSANANVLAGIILTITGNNDLTQTAELEVNGGLIKGDSAQGYGIGTNGTRPNTKITINGGTITGSVSIYHPSTGALTVTGGTLTGYDGIAIKGGTPVTITGGEFIATGEKIVPTEAVSSGCNSVGSALYVEGNYGFGAKVNISGGSFKTTDSNAPAVLSMFNTEDEATISITGGTFSSDPTAYVAPGYAATKNSDNTYTVKYLFAYKSDGTASAGTKEDPFLIANLEQFENISYVEKYSYFKWVGEKTVDASDLTDSVYLCGSFDGDNVAFNNLDKVLFRAVWNGSESWAPSEDTTNTYTVSNLTVNANIVTDGWIAAVVRVAGVHKFVMDNVTVHGYVEGATGVASFVCFGPGNYAPTSYTYDGNITFKNCNSDATLVAKSGNAVGFIAHPMMATSAGRITLENSNYSGDMSATSAGGCKYVSGNWINAIITDNQSETKNNTTYNSGVNGWTYIAENKTGAFTVEQQNKPETIGNVFTVTAKEGATRATFALQISPDPGNFTSTYLVEEVNVANNSFTSEEVKYFEVKVNAEGATETGAVGNVYHVVNPIYGTSLGSNTIVRVTQYDDAGKILGITTINFDDKPEYK